MSDQKPLQLILARNLLSSISTPAFLVSDQAELLFYNESAGALVGRRFEETGIMSAAEWTRQFGPFDEHGEPLRFDEMPSAAAVREGRPSHDTFRICTAGGNHQNVAASTIPIVGPTGSTGAIVIFWPLAEAEDVEMQA